METPMTDSDQAFNKPTVEEMISTNIRNVLKNREYQADKVSEWLSTIFVGILNSLVPLGQRFKYCCTGIITQNCGAALHQATSCRFEKNTDKHSKIKLKPNTSYNDSDISPLLGIKDEPDNQVSFWADNFKIILFGILYCIVSISAVFINKIILSRNGRYSEFGSVEFLMLIQVMFGILLLMLFRLFRIIEFDLILPKSTLLKIFGVNLLFMAQTTANAYAVRYLSMPMVALLKNCQVIVVCTLEFLILHTQPTKATISSLSIIFFGSICGSLTDLEFNFPGYLSMFVAIFSSAMYIIFIKIIFKDQKVNQFSLLFWNSLFSIPLFLLLSILRGAFMKALRFTLHSSSLFIFLLILSGFTGTGVNITTYMFIQVSSPTTFSVLGIIKKILQTLLGYLLWTSPTNVSNVISVIVGIIGGIIYSVSKTLEKNKTNH